MGTHPIFESDFDCLTEIEMSDSVFGSDSEEEMEQKAEYIEQLINLQKLNGILEFSQKDFPRYTVKEKMEMDKLKSFETTSDNSDTNVEEKRTTRKRARLRVNSQDKKKRSRHSVLANLSAQEKMDYLIGSPRRDQEARKAKSEKLK